MRKSSIRELLLLSAVIALAIGLWLDHRQLVDADRKLRENARLDAVAYMMPPNSPVGARITKTLQEAYSDVGGISMNYNAEDGELRIAATPREMAAIQVAINVMEKASSVEVASDETDENAVTR